MFHNFIRRVFNTGNTLSIFDSKKSFLLVVFTFHGWMDHKSPWSKICILKMKVVDCLASILFLGWMSFCIHLRYSLTLQKNDPEQFKQGNNWCLVWRYSYIYKQDEKDWCKDKTCVRKEKREKKRGAAIADRDVCLPTKIYDPDWC